LGLKWWQTADIIEREATVSRSKTDSILSKLARQQQLRQQEIEREKARVARLNAQMATNMVLAEQRARAADQIEEVNRKLAQLGIQDQVPITESTVKQQIMSGGSWGNDIVQQAEAATQQAREKELRKEGERWARWKAGEAGISWTKLTPLEQEDNIQHWMQRVATGDLPGAVTEQVTGAEQATKARYDIPEGGLELGEGFKVLPDYSIIDEYNQTVGKLDPETGAIAPISDSAGQKIKNFFSAVWKSIPLNPYYWMTPEQKQLTDYKNQLVEWAKSQNMPDPEGWVNEIMEKRTGELTIGPQKEGAEYKKLPPMPASYLYNAPEIEPGLPMTKGEQFVGEWLMPMLTLAMLPSAGQVSAALKPVAQAGGVTGGVAKAAQVALKPLTIYEKSIDTLIKLPPKAISTGTRKALQGYINKNAKYIRLLSTQRDPATFNLKERILYKIFNLHNRYMTEQAASALKAQAAARRGINQEIVASTQTVDNIVTAIQSGKELTTTSVKGLIAKNTPKLFIAGINDIIAGETAAKAVKPTVTSTLQRVFDGEAIWDKIWNSLNKSVRVEVLRRANIPIDVATDPARKLSLETKARILETSPGTFSQLGIKQPWEMTGYDFESNEAYLNWLEKQNPTQLTQAQYVERWLWQKPENVNYETGEVIAKGEHKGYIRKALSRGTPVAPEILKDYPDLKPTIPEVETTALAEGETVTGEVPEGEVKVELTEAGMSPSELARIRQTIMGVGKAKGLSKTALNSIFKQVAGRTPDNRQMPWHLTEMSDEQLQDTLEIVKTARPIRIGTKIVIRPSTEKKIQSLKQSLINEGKLSEEAFNGMVAELKLPATRYENAKKFITEREGKTLIRLMNDEAEIGLIQKETRIEKALDQYPEVKAAYNEYSNIMEKQGRVYFEGKPADASILEDMRFAMKDLQIRTGQPFYDTYFALNRAKNANRAYLRDARLRISASTPEYKALITDRASMKRIQDYIAAKNKWAKVKSPEDITEEEIKLANAYEKELFDLQPDFRYHRFLQHYNTTEGDIAKMHEHIPDAPIEDLRIAVRIYESQGASRLKAYLDTKTWGIIESGYEPHYVVSPQLAMRKLRATFPTRRFEPRTGVEFYPEDITIDRAVGRYIRQMVSYNLRPYIRKLERVYAKSRPQLKNPQKINRGLTVMANEMLGYKDRSFLGELIMKAASQAYITVFGTFPVLPFRNLFQNLAFHPDKSALIDPRNEKMTDWDLQFYDIHVSQMKGVEDDLLLAEEGGLPGFRRINRFILGLNLYGASDSKINRIWSQWASLNKAQRALNQYKTDGDIKKFITNSGMAGLDIIQQKQVLGNLVLDEVDIPGLPPTMGEHAAITEIATEITNNVHFLYDRSQRAWIEMGETGRLIGSLVVFPRSVVQRIIVQAKDLSPNSKAPPVKKKRALKILLAMLWGSLAANFLFQKATGRQDAPYNPANILKWSPGGLSIGAVSSLAEVSGLLFMAMGGSDWAKTQLPAAITKTSDTFVPCYKMVVQALEAAANKKQIDRQLYRELRSIIDNAMVEMGFLDKAYQPNESYYEAERSWAWKIKHALFGTEPDEKATEKAKIQKNYAQLYGYEKWADMPDYLKERFYELRPDLK